MPPQVFAVDRAALRFGFFPRVGSGLEMRELHEVELPDGTFGKGVLGPTLQQERSFRAALEDLLGRLGEPVTEASLVVPDGWLRVVFADIEDLPRREVERDEVLRWKLRGLVPFRVEDLRLRAVPVSAAGSNGTERWLLAFAVETLMSHLESIFSANGIRIGHLSNVGLSLLEAVWRAAGREEPQGVVGVEGKAYTLILADDSGPAVFRHKSLEADTPVGVVEQMVRRELRLARSYATEHEVLPERLFLFAEPVAEQTWSDWLREELGVAEIRSGRELLRLTTAAAEHDPARLVPLIGAVSSFV